VLLCTLIVIAPLVAAVVAPVVGVVASLAASPTVADTVETAPAVVDSADSSWIGREVDRRGRILPRRDARGRFIRSNAV